MLLPRQAKCGIIQVPIISQLIARLATQACYFSRTQLITICGLPSLHPASRTCISVILIAVLSKTSAKQLHSPRKCSPNRDKISNGTYFEVPFSTCSYHISYCISTLSIPECSGCGRELRGNVSSHYLPRLRTIRCIKTNLPRSDVAT